MYHGVEGMGIQKPIPKQVIRDDFTTGTISGGGGNDHLIHHRDLGVESHSSTGLFGFAGDDILEASVPDKGQIHMFAATGDDWLILDVSKIPNASGTQGHHAYGGPGNNTYQFTNIDQNFSPIIGRLDDFNPASDRILIEEVEVDIYDLPKIIKLPSGKSVEVRVIELDHPEFAGEDLGPQYFLAIGDDIFYALDGARDLGNGISGLHGEERHFLLPEALEELRNAETVQYVNPKNFIPQDFYEHRENDLIMNFGLKGHEIKAELGDGNAVHMFGAKNNSGAHNSTGAQTMRGSDGNDVINGNTGNDTIFGGHGDDLIAGGIDNDLIYGGPGDDMIWGGDGDDSLYGGRGNDYLHGGRGDDLLVGGKGNDTLVGGRGNNTLVGGGGEHSVNRFHFFEDEGNHLITDFKIESDLITFQHEVDPLSVEIYENDNGNVIVNYGHKASVELRGVSLQDFQEAAQLRADEDNPIISITPDPEQELLLQLRIETGYYGDEAPPSLYVDGILYGSKAFDSAGPGGYQYVDESELPPEDDVIIDIPPDDDEKKQEKDEDEEKDDGDGTCFVATAAYRDLWHPDVVFLRSFRDEWLVHRSWGRRFVKFYWWVGPKIAKPVRRNMILGYIAKSTIAMVVAMLRITWR